MGVRNRNYRKGDLAEGMGLELLRRFAVVAPVPRPEDIGLDGVCTLLRRDGRRLVGENTFGVQVKAASVRAITLARENAQWLEGLEMPVFWISVNLKKARVEVYSFEWAFSEELTPSGITLLLDRPSEARTTEAQPWLVDSDTSGASGPRRFWLGPPVWTFRFGAVARDAYVESTFPLLKAWTEMALTCARSRSTGVRQWIRWETNKPPRPMAMLISADERDVRDTLGSMHPLLLRLETALYRVGDSAAELKAAVAVLRRKAEDLGIR
jgi:hypothetical protein